MTKKKANNSGGRRGFTTLAAAAAIIAMIAALGIGMGSMLIGAPTKDAAPAKEPTAPATTESGAVNKDVLHLDRSEPRRITVPAIGVRDQLTRLALQKGKDLVQTPPARKAGWYHGSVTPGEIGVAVVVGYIAKGPTAPGVFHRLRDLRKQDKIMITRADGSVAVFRVTDISKYKEGKFPAEKVYAPTKTAQLRIVTCGGTLSPKDPPGNVVVSAQLLKTRPASAKAG